MSRPQRKVRVRKLAPGVSGQDPGGCRPKGPKPLRFPKKALPQRRTPFSPALFRIAMLWAQDKLTTEQAQAKAGIKSSASFYVRVATQFRAAVREGRLVEAKAK